MCRPTTPSILVGCKLDEGLIQKSLPQKELVQSDLDCLHVNIAAPEGTTSASNLPVLVFIHGGGFNIGANSWPQFDWNRLVALSQSRDLPIVAVSMKSVLTLSLPLCSRTFVSQSMFGVSVIVWMSLDFLHRKNYAQLDTRPTMAFEIRGLQYYGYKSIFETLVVTQTTLPLQERVLEEVKDQIYS